MVYVVSPVVRSKGSGSNRSIHINCNIQIIDESTSTLRPSERFEDVTHGTATIGRNVLCYDPETATVHVAQLLAFVVLMILHLASSLGALLPGDGTNRNTLE